MAVASAKGEHEMWTSDFLTTLPQVQGSWKKRSQDKSIWNKLGDCAGTVSFVCFQERNAMMHVLPVSFVEAAAVLPTLHLDGSASLTEQEQQTILNKEQGKHSQTCIDSPKTQLVFSDLGNDVASTLCPTLIICICHWLWMRHCLFKSNHYDGLKLDDAWVADRKSNIL